LVGRLSGGERARILIAQLVLQPADVLLLDEPTNDLDIPTLEILEESLLEFRGAMILVTHDRFMMDRVSTIVLGLDGLGGTEIFADYSQWETWQRTQASITAARSLPRTSETRAAGSPPAKRKLSYLEARELAAIEERIAETEQRLLATRAALEDPSIASDGSALLAAFAEVEEAQKLVDALYARWSELEQKQS
jgi:ABC transport system ATP-binding/permease protein